MDTYPMTIRMLATMCVAALAVVGVGVLLHEGTKPPSASSPLADAPQPVRIPRQLVATHLEIAHERTEEAIFNHFGPIRSLLNQGRANAGSFADTALGWGSKWRIVADAVPFTSGDRNAVYLKEQFERLILSGPDLQRAVEQCVSEYLAELRSIENNMLVDLRADIQNLSPLYESTMLPENELQAKFDIAIERAMQLASGDLQANISSQLVSLIVGEVLTQVAVRLGVSAGILGTGAASGWATLGIGVVVGIIIDQIVMAIWSRWSDPKGQLVDTIVHQLNVVQDLICLGDSQTKGLAKHFKAISDARAKLRSSAIYEILGPELTPEPRANSSSATQILPLVIPSS
jgi:hypothetical protein